MVFLVLVRFGLSEAAVGRNWSYETPFLARCRSATYFPVLDLLADTYGRMRRMLAALGSSATLLICSMPYCPL
jgi:hypothetical protein